MESETEAEEDIAMTTPDATDHRRPCQSVSVTADIDNCQTHSGGGLGSSRQMLEEMGEIFISQLIYL